jgi:hypothetical protein
MAEGGDSLEPPPSRVQISPKRPKGEIDYILCGEKLAHVFTVIYIMHHAADKGFVLGL